jgi:hypothetical protein
MKLVSMVIDLRSGIVFCSAEKISENGVTSSVAFTIPESQLLADAASQGRYTWDNEDVLRIGSTLFGNPIT